MPHYKCTKCDYSTKSRQSITRHLNNKNPCRTQVIELNSPADLDAHIYEDIPENLLLKQIRDLQAENTELKSKGINEINNFDVILTQNNYFSSNIGYSPFHDIPP